MIFFQVQLIKLREKPKTEYQKLTLEQNCAHVWGDYHIFEGEPSYLAKDGLKFSIVATGSVPSLKGMDQHQLVETTREHLGFDPIKGEYSGITYEL